MQVQSVSSLFRALDPQSQGGWLDCDTIVYHQKVPWTILVAKGNSLNGVSEATPDEICPHLPTPLSCLNAPESVQLDLFGWSKGRSLGMEEFSSQQPIGKPDPPKPRNDTL